MNTKTLLAGLVGGVALFFLGWVIYGMLLKTWMENPSNFDQCMNIKDMKDMVMWAMALGCVFIGLMLALVLNWANANNFMAGAMKAGMLSLLMSLGYSLQMHSMTTMYSGGLSVLSIDVVIGTVMMSIIGGIVGWMLGRGNSSVSA